MRVQCPFPLPVLLSLLVHFFIIKCNEKEGLIMTRTFIFMPLQMLLLRFNLLNICQSAYIFRDLSNLLRWTSVEMARKGENSKDEKEVEEHRNKYRWTKARKEREWGEEGNTSRNKLGAEQIWKGRGRRSREKTEKSKWERGKEGTLQTRHYL